MATKLLKQIKAHCPQCGPDRWAHIKARHRVHEDHDGVWAETQYYILQCPACDAVYFLSDAIFSEDMSYECNPHTGEEESDYKHTIQQWPSPSRRDMPRWSSDIWIIDDALHRLLLDTYRALDNDLGIFAAIGIRTVFDRVSEFLEIDPAKRFDEKLDELVTLGKIGADEREMLDALTDAGSAAAHRGWVPSADQLDTMMASIEGFIFRTFILGDSTKRLKASVPPKPLRKKKPNTLRPPVESSPT